MKEKGAVRFVVVSDIHFALNHGRFGSVLIDRSESILKRAISDINGLPDIDFIIINGDSVNVPTAYDTARLAEMLGRFLPPYYITPGNHDVPQPPGVSTLESVAPALTKRQFLRELDAYGAIPDDRTWWTARPTDWLRIIALDATFTGDWGGTLPQRQLHWLSDTLKNAKNTINIVFIHHALAHPWENFDLDERYVVENASEVRDVLDASGAVHAVISGHMHRSGCIELHGIPYFITPSLSTYPCGYGLFTVTRGTIDYEMIQIGDAGIIGEARALRYEKEAEIPAGKREAWRHMIEGLREMQITFTAP